jgi:hypothetical protein
MLFDANPRNKDRKKKKVSFFEAMKHLRQIKCVMTCDGFDLSIPQAPANEVLNTMKMDLEALKNEYGNPFFSRKLTSENSQANPAQCEILYFTNPQSHQT